MHLLRWIKRIGLFLGFLIGVSSLSSVAHGAVDGYTTPSTGGALNAPMPVSAPIGRLPKAMPIPFIRHLCRFMIETLT